MNEITTIDQQVDTVLARMSNGKVYNMGALIALLVKEKDGYKQGILVRYMTEKNLVKLIKQRGYVITGNGSKIVEQFGGWINYLKGQDTIENELLQLKLENDAFQRRHQRVNTRINSGVLIIGLCGLVATWYTIHLNNKTDSLEATVISLTETNDSLRIEIDRIRTNHDTTSVRATE